MSPKLIYDKIIAQTHANYNNKKKDLSHHLQLFLAITKICEVTPPKDSIVYYSRDSQPALDEVEISSHCLHLYMNSHGRFSI